MAIDNAERITAILNSEDLTMGLRWTQEGTRLLLEGGGDEAALTVKAAKAVLEVMRVHWGHEAIHTRAFAGLVRQACAR